MITMPAETFDVSARKVHQWTMVVLVLAGFVLGGLVSDVVAAVLLVVAWLILLVGWQVVRLWLGHRTRAAAATPVAAVWSQLGAQPDGRPAVVAFSTSSCAECRVQARVLEPLTGPAVRLLQVNAAEQPQVARR